VLVFSSAHGSFWEKTVWLLLSRWYRVPMTVMMVDGNFPRFYEGLSAPLRTVASGLLERFNTVLVQTESWRRFYSGIAPDGNYKVLPNGVDCEEFTPPKGRAPSARPVLLFVGWLIPEKGVFDLLDAARILAGADASDARFSVRLIGPFHGYEPALRAHIAKANLQGLVEVVGVVRSRAEIIAAYQSADIFVLPSWAEGLPVALLEAMACGLPVVASRVGGIPDLVQENTCGFLVPPRDPIALATALEQLITQPKMRYDFGHASRSRVENAFSNAIFMRGVLSLLKA
jgi:glycosyltransferase involved in cell wall biosynthesis